MSELFIELFSEEIHKITNISAEAQLERLLTQNLSSLNLKHETLNVYSTPTRLVAFISGLPTKLKFKLQRLKDTKLVFQKM